jgi:hypothetical protein
MAYIPKNLKQEELKEFLTPEAMVLVKTYFEGNPKKTVFKLTDKKHTVTVRRITYLGMKRFTVMMR